MQSLAQARKQHEMDRAEHELALMSLTNEHQRQAAALAKRAKEDQAELQQKARNFEFENSKARSELAEAKEYVKELERGLTQVKQEAAEAQARRGTQRE